MRIKKEEGLLKRKHYWSVTYDLNKAYFFDNSKSAHNRIDNMELDNIKYSKSEVKYLHIPKKAKLINDKKRNTKVWAFKDKQGVKYYDEGGYLQKRIFDRDGQLIYDK